MNPTQREIDDVLGRCCDALKPYKPIYDSQADDKAMRRDAERYRWLRQDAAAAGWKPPRCPNPCPDGIATCTTRHTHEVTGAALDDAIEAAMREQGANTGNEPPR